MPADSGLENCWDCRRRRSRRCRSKSACRTRDLRQAWPQLRSRLLRWLRCRGRCSLSGTTFRERCWRESTAGGLPNRKKSEVCLQSAGNAAGKSRKEFFVPLSRESKRLHASSTPKIHSECMLIALSALKKPVLSDSIQCKTWGRRGNRPCWMNFD